MSRSTTGRLGDVEIAVAEHGEQLERLFGKIDRLSGGMARIESTLNLVVVDLRILREAVGIAFAGRANGHTWEDARAHYGRAAEMLETGENDDQRTI